MARVGGRIVGQWTKPQVMVPIRCRWHRHIPIDGVQGILSVGGACGPKGSDDGRGYRAFDRGSQPYDWNVVVVVVHWVVTIFIFQHVEIGPVDTGIVIRS